MGNVEVAGTRNLNERQFFRTKEPDPPLPRVRLVTQPRESPHIPPNEIVGELVGDSGEYLTIDTGAPWLHDVHHSDILDRQNL